MEWHFGYNCNNILLPTFQRCRVLIEDRRKRRELLSERWLTTTELLVYVDQPRAKLLRMIASGEIKANVKKNGKMEFCVSSGWQYDDCPLADMGGQCLYFQEHRGRKIRFLAELDRTLVEQHPNKDLIPSEDEIARFEAEVQKIVTMPLMAATD